ncbi:MAG: hypothetical protein ABIF19_03065 [Planctomycetota bacterium]
MKKDYNRLRIFALLAVVPALIIAVWPAGGLGKALGEQQDSWTAFKVIVERNMFSRQRGSRVEQSRTEQVRTPPVLSPESYYVLKGIAQENGEFVAFLEDTQRGRILRVRKGDSVARGVVKALTLDTIEYQFEDRTTTVAMGYDLEGGQGVVTLTQMYELSQTYSTTPQQPATQPASPSEDEAEILKQLMERRQQQVGQ